MLRPAQMIASARRMLELPLLCFLVRNAYASRIMNSPVDDPVVLPQEGSAMIQRRFGTHAISSFGLSEQAMSAMFIVQGGRESWLNLSRVKPSTNVGVSLCIPCVPEDVEALKDTLVPSILQQTLKPKEVIFAISGIPKEDSALLETELQSKLVDVPVTVNAIEGQAYAGANRNRAENLATGDLIAFFDADDAMHPRRLEVLAYIWEKYHPKVILHGWSEGVESSLHLEQQFQLIEGMEIATYGLGILGKLAHAVHQGQPAVDKKVFASVRERDDLPRGQDVQFLHDVMAKFGESDSTIMYVGLPLTRFSNWRTGR
jgi:hypothetical protein